MGKKERKEKDENKEVMASNQAHGPASQENVFHRLLESQSMEMSGDHRTRTITEGSDYGSVDTK